ncbi:FkbM family methyltransferase [Lentibacter algarum]|uniref:FkbM family methyltransferase n=1 Tax=Lentibacter algarum TaxID=576131 RepID=UPI001C088867|nr:FkbM family methyltransferase [Lentibacter algarum]MBU2982594.1 FkbM family methyltransferase [Lentibacter algarum]
MDGQASPKSKFKMVASRGILVPRDPAIMTPKLRRKLRMDAYEAKEAQIVLKCVSKGDTVLELGGGIGYISTLIAKKRDVAAVHSFEANPHLAPFHAQMHAANGVTTVTTHNALLAPRKGKPQPFYVREDFLASSLEEEIDGMPVKSVEEVEVRGLNAVFKELKPDILVCDIEGAEATLLPHLKYAGLRAAIIELHPQWIGAEGVRSVFDAMHAIGLTYFPQWSDQKVVCFRKAWKTK